MNRKLPTKARPASKARPSLTPAQPPTPGGLLLGAVFDGMMAASMVARLRALHKAMEAGDHNAHVLLWELRRAYEFARKYPGVAASLVFVLCTEFLPYVGSRMGQKAPDPGNLYPILPIEDLGEFDPNEEIGTPTAGPKRERRSALQRKPCGHYHASYEACDLECEDAQAKRNEDQ